MKKVLIALLSLLMTCLLFSSAMAEQPAQSGKLTSTMTVSLHIPEYHRVSLSCGLHGSMLVDEEPFDGNQQLVLSKEGNFVITAIPDEGYELNEIRVSVEEGVSLVGNTLYVTDLKQDITIKITFIREAAHVHEPVVDEAVPASCTENGLAEGSHCSKCGKTIEEQQIIPATGHDYQLIPEQKPTCTEPGHTASYACINCGDPIVPGTVLDAPGHTVITVPAVASTCTEAGTTEGTMCTVCGEILSGCESTAALNHHYVIVSARPATCAENGNTQGVACERCNDQLVPYDILTATGIHHYHDGACCDCGQSFSLNGFSVLKLPEQMSFIEPEAFQGIAVEAIILPQSCTGIGENAFDQCNSLRYIFVPSCIDISALRNALGSSTPQIIYQ